MISVYTVNKNTEIEWIRQCAEAVAEQKFRKFNYVFLDYGSENVEQIYYMLMDILEDVDFKFVAIDQKHDFSFIDAIRAAISNCTFKYVLRADADDFMHRDCLKHLIMHSLGNSVIYPDYYVINEENIYIEVKMHNKFLPAHALIEKRVYNKVNYKNGQKFRDGTSLEVALEKHPEFKVKHVEERLFFYRKHNNSLTSNKKEVAKADKEINR